MARAFAELAFTPTVRATQDRMGSGTLHQRFLSPDRQGGDQLGAQEAAFIAQRDGFYQATVSETGWPYVQVRGGPAGFLKVLGPQLIGYADLRGNRQYLSVGNLATDDRISLILLDYAARRRLKIWGHGQVLEADAAADCLEQLSDGLSGRAERAILIRVAAIDWNCPSHIPQRLTEAEWRRENADLDRQPHGPAAEKGGPGRVPDRISGCAALPRNAARRDTAKSHSGSVERPAALPNPGHLRPRSRVASHLSSSMRGLRMGDRGSWLGAGSTTVASARDRAAFVVKWGASILQILGYAGTGVGWTPWNLYLFLVGVLGWFAVGVLWNDKAIMLIHLVALGAMLVGLASR